jgi:hypothetical protein
VATIEPIQEHETLSLRALATQARTNLDGHARLHQVVFDQGFLDGVALWWLDRHGMLFMVPARENMALTVDAQAQAAAGIDDTLWPGQSRLERAVGDRGGGHRVDEA